MDDLLFLIIENVKTFLICIRMYFFIKVTAVGHDKKKCIYVFSSFDYDPVSVHY